MYTLPPPPSRPPSSSSDRRDGRPLCVCVCDTPICQMASGCRDDDLAPAPALRFLGTCLLLRGFYTCLPTSLPACTPYSPYLCLVARPPARPAHQMKLPAHTLGRSTHTPAFHVSLLSHLFPLAAIFIQNVVPDLDDHPPFFFYSPLPPLLPLPCALTHTNSRFHPSVFRTLRLPFRQISLARYPRADRCLEL